MWNKCNSNCVMCTNPTQFKEGEVDFSLKTIRQRLINHKKTDKEFIGDNSSDKFYLTGGEPTLNPDLYKIIKEINIFFPRNEVSLLTNGRTFYYEDYVKKILSLENLNEIIIPLHGHDRKTHDRVTRSVGSFDQAFLGIKNVFKFKRDDQKVEVRVVISKFNYKGIDKILSLLEKHFYKANSIPVIFMEFEGQAEDNHNSVGIKYSDFKESFKGLEKFIDTLPGLRFYHFPLCTIPEIFWPITWKTLPDYEVFYGTNCSQCLYKKECLGIHKHYNEIYGGAEFVPIKKKVNIKKSGNFFKPFAIKK